LSNGRLCIHGNKAEENEEKDEQVFHKNFGMLLRNVSGKNGFLKGERENQHPPLTLIKFLTKIGMNYFL
jgi:hypothetical protein